jgi:hypothetical protein
MFSVVTELLDMAWLFFVSFHTGRQNLVRRSNVGPKFALASPDGALRVDPHTFHTNSL